MSTEYLASIVDFDIFYRGSENFDLLAEPRVSGIHPLETMSFWSQHAFMDLYQIIVPMF